jgi:Universal stress protein family
VRLGRRERRGGPSAKSARRILFPFIGSTVSQATLDAALRLARLQDATMVPAYLVVIPHHLSLESPAPVRESEAALPVLELIDQRASRAGVPVDSRIERGRSHRHALATLIEHERYDTLVVPARTSTSDGFDAADVAWLLENAPGEVLVLRTGEAVRAPHLSAEAT